MDPRLINRGVKGLAPFKTDLLMLPKHKQDFALFLLLCLNQRKHLFQIDDLFLDGQFYNRFDGGQKGFGEGIGKESHGRILAAGGRTPGS
jgi:hypothetical protein